MKRNTALALFAVVAVLGVLAAVGAAFSMRRHVRAAWTDHFARALPNNYVIVGESSTQRANVAVTNGDSYTLLLLDELGKDCLISGIAICNEVVLIVTGHGDTAVCAVLDTRTGTRRRVEGADAAVATFQQFSTANGPPCATAVRPLSSLPLTDVVYSSGSR